MSGHVDLREAVECGDVLGVDGFEGVEGHLEPPSFPEALEDSHSAAPRHSYGNVCSTEERSGPFDGLGCRGCGGVTAAVSIIAEASTIAGAWGYRRF